MFKNREISGDAECLIFPHTIPPYEGIELERGFEMFSQVHVCVGPNFFPGLNFVPLGATLALLQSGLTMQIIT